MIQCRLNIVLCSSPLVFFCFVSNNLFSYFLFEKFFYSISRLDQYHSLSAFFCISNGLVFYFLFDEILKFMPNRFDEISSEKLYKHKAKCNPDWDTIERR